MQIELVLSLHHNPHRPHQRLSPRTNTDNLSTPDYPAVLAYIGMHHEP